MTELVFQILRTTVEPPPMAASRQEPPPYNGNIFGRQSIHSLLFQPLYDGWLLCFVPKMAIVERFNCILYGIVQCMEISHVNEKTVRGTNCRYLSRVS